MSRALTVVFAIFVLWLFRSTPLLGIGIMIFLYTFTPLRRILLQGA